eukprot:2483180-Prymnesium_polylepis.4
MCSLLWPQLSGLPLSLSCPPHLKSNPCLPAAWQTWTRQIRLSALKRWVRHMVSSYEIDALRLDTAPYVPLPYLSEWAAAAGVEVLGGGHGVEPDLPRVVYARPDKRHPSARCVCRRSHRPDVPRADVPRAPANSPERAPANSPDLAPANSPDASSSCGMVMREQGTLSCASKLVFWQLACSNVPLYYHSPNPILAAGMLN